jgi:DNA-binding Xre family transcriptional regulator
MSKNKQVTIGEFLGLQKSEAEQGKFDAMKLHLETMVKIGGVMKAKGIKRCQLAEMIGLNRSAITKFFKGDELLNLKTLAKIQRALNVAILISICEK